MAAAAARLAAATAQEARLLQSTHDQIRLKVDESLLLSQAPFAARCTALENVAEKLRKNAPRRAPPHPVIVQSAKRRGGAFTREEGRLGSWKNCSNRIFHLTHIAKTGGRSVREEMLRLVEPVGGAEQCLAPFVHPSRVNVIFFREPRGHTLSQYLHSVFAPTKKMAARRAAGLPQSGDMNGYEKWLTHFAHGWTPAKGDFVSYNPLNMMARTLTCRALHWNCDFLTACDEPCSHHVGPDASDASPPLGPALAAVHTAEMVGVLELLSETMCLMEFRLRGKVPRRCTCAAGGGLRGRAHVGRRENASRLSVAAAPRGVLRLADAITAIDALVYRAAIVRLLCDIQQLERAIGAQVLCPQKLDALIAQTSHIPGLWSPPSPAPAVP